MTEVSAKSNSEIRRAEVLDAAAHLFSTRGFHATGMRDLAQHLDIKAGSLYYHINSKEQLLSEICIIGMNKLNENVDRAIAENTSLTDTVKAIVVAHVDLSQNYGHFLYCYQNEYKHLPAETYEKVRAQLVSFHQTLENIFTRAIEKGEADPGINVKHARHALIAVLQHLHRPDQSKTKASFSSMASALADILINGVAPR